MTSSRRSAPTVFVGALLLLAVAGGCSSDSGGVVTSKIRLSVLGQAALSGAVAVLRLSLYGPGGWLVTRRLGELGSEGTTVVFAPIAEGELRLLLRAHDTGDALLGEGTTEVTLSPGAEVPASITLSAGNKPDGDGDGVPDAIDNCPALPNPEQTPCTTGDAGPGDDVGPVDGPRDFAPIDSVTPLDGITDMKRLDGPSSCAMTGSYLITPSASGSKTFKTFAAAFAELKTCGVSGAVSLLVAAGTYAESGFDVPAIPGASSSAKVTFQRLSGAVRLVGSVGRYVVKIAAGARHIRLDGFEIDGSVSGNAITTAGGGLIMLDVAGGQRDITFGNLYLHDLSGSQWIGAATSAALNLSTASNALSIEDIVVEGCRFERLDPPVVQATQAALLLHRGTRRRITIRRNRFYELGNLDAIQVHSDTVEALQVENNFFVLTKGTRTALRFSNSPTVVASGSHFVYNSALVAQENASGLAGTLASGSLLVRNNIFALMAGSSGKKATFVLLGPSSATAGASNACLANAEAGFSGNDISKHSDIKFVGAVAPFDLHLQSSSSCRRRGLAIPSVTDDIDGDKRPTTDPDSGADEIP